MGIWDWLIHVKRWVKKGQVKRTSSWLVSRAWIVLDTMWCLLLKISPWMTWENIVMEQNAMAGVIM